MPREIPDCPKKPNPTAEAGRSYEIELITPIFGGGVEPRVNDPSFPIRPTTIRGQLQFWWRATVGAQYATLAKLRAAQSAVWGSTEHASRVQVLVELIGKSSDPVPCARSNRITKGRTESTGNLRFAFGKTREMMRCPMCCFRSKENRRTRKDRRLILRAASIRPSVGCTFAVRMTSGRKSSRRCGRG